MSEHTQPQGTPVPPSQQAPGRHRFLTGLMTGGLLGSLLTGGWHLYAHASPGLDGWLRGGSGGGGWCRHAGHDAARDGAHAEFVADWLLTRVGATETQRQQARTIVQAAWRDLPSLRDQHQQQRQQLLGLLQQASIDRLALDAVRQAELQLAATASERLVATLADLAEVLTPEQRSRLVEYIQQWHF